MGHIMGNVRINSGISPIRATPYQTVSQDPCAIEWDAGASANAGRQLALRGFRLRPLGSGATSRLGRPLDAPLAVLGACSWQATLLLRDPTPAHVVVEPPRLCAIMPRR